MGQSLRVQTVPGVLYHLQVSDSLEESSWSSVEQLYGTGGEWICPIMRGSEPSESPPVSQNLIPHPPLNPMRSVYLIMQRVATGGVLVSWRSLDDQMPKQMHLTNLILDPVWDEFDSSYMNGHGNFFFALSPQPERPAAFAASNPSLGSLDTAMIAEFSNSLRAMTENITNSVAMAAMYSHQNQPVGERKFYRISADWSLDSDSDGHPDWQELVFDGNNPFAADSDGDGQPDQAAQSSEGSGSSTATGYPEPTDAQGPTPLASIQQVTIGIRRDFTYYRDENRIPHIEVHPGTEEFLPDCAEIAWDQTLQHSAEEGATTHAVLADLVNGIPIPENAWWDDLRNFHGLNRSITHAAPHEATIAGSFVACRSWFRLKLDAPAPAGGYRIPLRIGLVRQTIAQNGTGSYLAPSGSQTNFIEIRLECAEGQTIGTAVSIDAPADLPANQAITYIPASITTREPDIVPEVDDVVRFDLAQPGPVDPDGACVTPLQGFTVNFGNDRATSIPYRNWTRPVVRWYKRKLLGNGTLESNGDGSPKWERMSYDHDNKPFEGTHLSVHSRYPGIYQLQARMVLPEGQEIEFPFVRLRDDRSIADSSVPPRVNPLQKAGSPDFFGVANGSEKILLRNSARSWLGSIQYRRGAHVDIYPGSATNPSMIDADKCTTFLLHVGNTSGMPVPFYWRYAGLVAYAPLAREHWYHDPEKMTPDLDTSGWKHIGYSAPQISISPGQIVAGYGTGKSNGHVGILDYDGTWISAGPAKVNKYINMQSLDAHYRPFALRDFDP